MVKCLLIMLNLVTPTFSPFLTHEPASLRFSLMHLQHQCLRQNHGKSPASPQVHPTWVV